MQPVTRPTLPIDRTDELEYLAELRQEILTRFHESPYYIELKEKTCDVRRYMDKYRAVEKESLKAGKISTPSCLYLDRSQPLCFFMVLHFSFSDWSRIPEELHWGNRNKNGGLAKKRRKIDENGVSKVEEKLAKLEENEGAVDQEHEAQQNEREKELSSESEEEEEDKNKDIDDDQVSSRISFSRIRIFIF